MINIPMSFKHLNNKLQLSFDGCENNMNIILQQINATQIIILIFQ